MHWDRILFSAEESAHKAWFPVAREWLEFEDAELTPSPDGTFHARLLKQGPEVEGSPRTEFTGRWLTTPDHLLTTITRLRP